MKSLILKSSLMDIAPKKFMKYIINKTMKKLQEEPRTEVKTLFDTGNHWGRGLILTIEGVNSYHFTCKFTEGGPKFIYLKGTPLKPFPEPIVDKDVDELARISLSKDGPYANCKVVMPYPVFMQILAKEIGPTSAGKKELIKMFDYDGWGTQYHSTMMIKFYQAMKDAVNIV